MGIDSLHIAHFRNPLHNKEKQPAPYELNQQKRAIDKTPPDVGCLHQGVSLCLRGIHAH